MNQSWGEGPWAERLSDSWHRERGMGFPVLHPVEKPGEICSAVLSLRNIQNKKMLTTAGCGAVGLCWTSCEGKPPAAVWSCFSYINIWLIKPLLWNKPDEKPGFMRKALGQAGKDYGFINFRTPLCAQRGLGCSGILLGGGEMVLSWGSILSLPSWRPDWHLKKLSETM